MIMSSEKYRLGTRVAAEIFVYSKDNADPCIQNKFHFISLVYKPANTIPTFINTD